MRNFFKQNGDSAAFGWSWIVHSLFLRRKQALILLALTGAGYAVTLVFPITVQTAVDAIVAKRADLRLGGIAFLAIASIGVEVAITSRRQTLLVDLGLFLSRRFSRRAFAHLMRARIDGSDVRSGEVLNHFQQASKIENFGLHNFPDLIFDGGGAAVSLALAFYYDVVVASVFLVTAALFVFGMRKQFGVISETLDVFYASVGARQNVLAESVSGMATVKGLALEASRLQRWRAVTNSMLTHHKAVLLKSLKHRIRWQIMSRLLTVVVLGVGCWRMLEGHITVGDLLALQLLAQRVSGPILSAAAHYQAYLEANAAIRQLAVFFAQPKESAAIHPPARRFAKGGMKLSNVSFTYPDAARPALEDINLALPETGVVALVGRNGSGKSTLIQILLGLRRDFTGAVEIGGRDIRHYHPRWLRGQLGVVGQDTVLFSGTIRDNLAGGVRVRDDEALRKVLTFADALKFVEALPKGLDAELSENGHSLSGGQRQRLSIARAVVRDPSIALFDEPTAFLDAEAAVALEKRLERWGRDRLLILVTHHLAAARNADRILVLEEGRLVGDGSHERLLATTPEYATLWADYTRSLGTELSPHFSENASNGPVPERVAL